MHQYLLSFENRFYAKNQKIKIARRCFLNLCFLLIQHLSQFHTLCYVPYLIQNRKVIKDPTSYNVNIRGIKSADTATDIKKAYHKAALRHHADKVRILCACIIVILVWAFGYKGEPPSFLAFKTIVLRKLYFICFWFESRLVSCWLEVKLEMKANFGRKFHRRCTRMLISFSKWLEKHILRFQIQPKVIHMIFLLVNESEFIIKYSLRIRAGWARER